MITKNQIKIQIVKELLDKKQITFEQCLILIEEPDEKVYKLENQWPSNTPIYRNSSGNHSANDTYTSSTTGEITIK